jgi:hypothetical protein
MTTLHKQLRTLVERNTDLSQSDIPQILQKLVSDDESLLLVLIFKLNRCKTVNSIQRVVTLFINCIKGHHIPPCEADKDLLSNAAHWITKFATKNDSKSSAIKNNAFIAVWYQLMDILFAVARDKTNPHSKHLQKALVNQDLVELMIMYYPSEINSFTCNIIENAISYLIHQQNLSITHSHFQLVLIYKTLLPNTSLIQFLLYHGGITWLNTSDEREMNALKLLENTFIDSTVAHLKSDQLYECMNTLKKYGINDAMKLMNDYLRQMMKCDKNFQENNHNLILLNNLIQWFLLDRAEHSKRFNPCLVYFDTNVDFGHTCFSNFKEIYLGEECVKILKEQPICTTKDSGLLYTRPINEKKMLRKGKQDGTKLMQRLKDNALESL